MSGTLVGALAAAGLLGVTHAVEPDHVAGIASLTSEYGDSRLSALAGACFGLGHVLLVVVWLAVAYALLGHTSFPAVFDAIGTVGVGVVLGVLGATMAVGGLRAVVRTGDHDHGERTHSHPHLRLPGLDPTAHDHDARSYLATGVVGALFTLSPPVTMMVFAGTVLPAHGGSVVALAVGTYAVTITATMGVLGAGVGTLFGRTRGLSERSAAAVRTVAGFAIVALAGTLLLDSVGVLV
jgi:hypothetical protein